jgi:hypothetical protein
MTSGVAGPIIPGLGVVAFWFDAGGAGEGGENPGIVIPKFWQLPPISHWFTQNPAVKLRTFAYPGSQTHLKVGVREDVFVTTHCPLPQIPGNVQASAEAGAGARVSEDGAGDGELPVQFESNVQFGMLHGSVDVVRNGTKVWKVVQPGSQSQWYGKSKSSITLLLLGTHVPFWQSTSLQVSLPPPIHKVKSHKHHCNT